MRDCSGLAKGVALLLSSFGALLSLRQTAGEMVNYAQARWEHVVTLTNEGETHWHFISTLASPHFLRGFTVTWSFALISHLCSATALSLTPTPTPPHTRTLVFDKHLKYMTATCDFVLSHNYMVDCDRRGYWSPQWLTISSSGTFGITRNNEMKLVGLHDHFRNSLHNNHITS